MNSPLRDVAAARAGYYAPATECPMSSCQRRPRRSSPIAHAATALSYRMAMNGKRN